MIAQISDLDREMSDFDSIPMHIHANLDQIGTEAAIDAGLPYPRGQNDTVPASRPGQGLRTHEMP